MTAHTETTHPKPRLNPFAFPSDTDFRFVMLIAATISASFSIYSDLYLAFFPAATAHLVSCLITTYTGNSFNNWASSVHAFSLCIAPSYRIEAAWVGLGVALLFSVAGFIYWLLPVWKIWRDGLRLLETSNTPPGMMAYLEALRCQAELRQSPVFLLNPYSSAASGVAFGHLGRYYVVLHVGLIKLFQDDRPFFRAVVLHELAHLRNGDINKTYFTISIVWSFLLTALLPWIVSQFIIQFSYQNILDVFISGWGVLVLTVLIYLLRTAILQARELYADARVSEWDGSEGALGRVLVSLSHPKGGYLRRILRVHPDPDRRRSLLRDTSSMFRLGFWDTFMAGFIVSSVLYNVYGLLILLIKSSIAEIGSELVGAPLLIGTVGLGVWRAIFARQANGQTRPHFIAVTLGLVLGLLLGQPLSPFATQTGAGYFTSLGYTNRSSVLIDLTHQLYTSGYFTSLGYTKNESSFLSPFGLTSSTPFTLSVFLAQLASIAIVGVLLLILLYGLLRWMAACFGIWIEIAAGRSSPRRIYWVGLVITSIVLGIVLGEFAYYTTNYQLALAVPGAIQVIQQGFHLPTQNPVIVATFITFFGLMYDPLITVAFICLWVYPLTSWFWRKRASSIAASNWAFLDRSSQSRLMTPTFKEPFRLRRALILGLAGGIADCAIIYISLKDFILHLHPIFYAALLAAPLQGGIAALVAVSVRRLPVLHCLFTAFVASCLMDVAVTGYTLSFAHHITLAVVWRVILGINNEGAYALNINVGALLALLVGLLVSALAGWLRRLSRAHQRAYEPAA